MPMPTSRDAPRFSSDFIGFDIFLESVDELGTRAATDQRARIRWAIRYAGSEAASWKTLPTSSSDNATLAEFKQEVLTLYPHLRVDRRYAVGDLDRLVASNQLSVDVSREGLGSYFRRFRVISSWLVARGRLSVQQQGVMYLRGFPPLVRAAILCRLAITHQDIFPSDGYPFTDLSDAAAFVYESGCLDDPSPPAPSSDFSPVADPMGGLRHAIQTLGSLAQSATSSARVPSPFPLSHVPYQPAPGGAVQQPLQRGPVYDTNTPLVCTFCSSLEHVVQECTRVAPYIQQRKVVRNPDGQLSLPNGSLPSRTISGKNLRERFDNYWQLVGSPETEASRGSASTNYLQIVDSDERASQSETTFDDQVHSPTPSRSSSSPPSPVLRPLSTTLSPAEQEALEQVQLLQAKIDSIRKAQLIVIQNSRKTKPDEAEASPKERESTPVRNPTQQPIPNIFARGRSSPIPLHQRAFFPDFEKSPSKTEPRAKESPVQYPLEPTQPIENRPKMATREEASVSFEEVDLSDTFLGSPLDDSTVVANSSPHKDHERTLFPSCLDNYPVSPFLVRSSVSSHSSVSSFDPVSPFVKRTNWSVSPSKTSPTSLASTSSPPIAVWHSPGARYSRFRDVWSIPVFDPGTPPDASSSQESEPPIPDPHISVSNTLGQAFVCLKDAKEPRCPTPPQQDDSLVMRRNNLDPSAAVFPFPVSDTGISRRVEDQAEDSDEDDVPLSVIQARLRIPERTNPLRPPRTTDEHLLTERSNAMSMNPESLPSILSPPTSRISAHLLTSTPVLPLATSFTSNRARTSVLSISSSPPVSSRSSYSLEPDPGIANHGVQRSDRAIRREGELGIAQGFLHALKRPPDFDIKAYQHLIRQVMAFYLLDEKIFRKALGSAAHLMPEVTERLPIIKYTHDLLSDKGALTTLWNILGCFWWPMLNNDARGYLQTCLESRSNKQKDFHFPPWISTTANIAPTEMYRSVQKESQ